MYGKDWEKEEGEVTGTSQFATKSMTEGNELVWNMPFECSFRSIDPFGWPQITLTLLRFDSSGNAKAIAYGCLNVPMDSTRKTKRISFFSPLKQTLLQRFFNVFNRQENDILSEPTVIASGEGREITRAQAVGYVDVDIQVNCRDLDKFGINLR